MQSASTWDAAADAVEAGPRHLSDDVYFGPWAPGDGALGVLGALDGVGVLDLGCGGGENAVALARRGAVVTGMDISPRQLARAAALGAAHGVDVAWRQGDMHDPAAWRDLRVACILAVYVLPYSEDLHKVLTLCRDALTPGGRLVMTMDHPLRGCFWDGEEGEIGPVPLRPYHAREPMNWQINGVPVRYATRPVGEWVRALHAAGLQLTQMLEPPPTADMIDTYWPVDSALGPLAHIPHTLILVAQRSTDDPEFTWKMETSA